MIDLTHDLPLGRQVNHDSGWPLPMWQIKQISDCVPYIGNAQATAIGRINRLQLRPKSIDDFWQFTILRDDCRLSGSWA